MNVDGDKGFVFNPFYRAKILGGHVDESVEEIQEGLIGFGHNFTVVTGISQSFFGISCPNHLDS